MDKRKTQRILGILVIIALVIILFPLLFSKNEISTTASITAPVFPDKLNTTSEQKDALVTTSTPEPILVETNTEISDAKQETLTPLAAIDSTPNPETNTATTHQNEQETKQPLELNTISSEETH